jgi:putative FmdB family regulatory protein
MPTYDFKCDDCGHAFEQLLSVKDRNLKVCPECRGKNLVREISAGCGVIFKGTGFYETDYKRKRP